MAVQEGLGGLRRVSLHEAAVAVGQVDDAAVGLPLGAADDHQGLPEVALGVSRRMGQRHEHLLGLTAILSDVVLDRGVSAVEPVLVPEPLEDALGRVALLPGTPVVVLQDPVDDAGVGLQLGTPGRDLSPVSRRHGVASILRTVSRCRPNVRAASRRLIPSTITALRTRRYTSTLYIRRTIHGVGYNPMNDGGRYSIWSPILSNLPPTRPTLTPPFTPRCSNSIPQPWCWRSRADWNCPWWQPWQLPPGR